MWADEPIPEYIIRTPFFEDPDKGPVSAWSALSRFKVYFIDEDLWDENIEYESLYPLPWGYVFWDLNMLENAGFKNISVEDRINSDFGVTLPAGHIEREEYNPLQKYTSNQATELLYLSHHEKQLMRTRGENGYFNFEAFCESVKDHLFSNMHEIEEGTLCDALDIVSAQNGLKGLLGWAAIGLEGWG
jgi:hypothetical protein